MIKMKIERFIFPIFAGLAIPNPCSAAAFQSGNALLQLCSSTDELQRGECLGYIVAVADMLLQPNESTLTEKGKTYPRPRACIRHGATKGQIQDIAVKYLREHPELRDYSAEGPVSLALVVAFPC